MGVVEDSAILVRRDSPAERAEDELAHCQCVIAKRCDSDAGAAGQNASSEGRQKDVGESK
jgi:hypothetical protein